MLPLVIVLLGDVDALVPPGGRETLSEWVKFAGIRPEVTSLSAGVLLSWGELNELTLSRYTAASYNLRRLRIQCATMINMC